MTTSAVLQLKKGIDLALSRLEDVRKRRPIESIIVKNDADENDSGWSEEEWVKTQTCPVTISHEDFLKLFGAIGSISTLQELCIDYYLQPIPIQALSLALQRLRKLRLYHVNLAGQKEDFQLFSTEVTKQSALSEVVLSSCQTLLKSSGQLIEAITSSVALAELSIEEMVVPGEPLTEMFCSPSIRKVKLRHIPTCNQHMPMIADALRHNNTLQELHIQYSLGQEAVIALAGMLERNKTMQRLVFDLDIWENYCQFIAKAIYHNSCLRSLEVNIFGEDKRIETSAETIANSFEGNASLKRFCLTFHNRIHGNEAEQESSLERMEKAFVGSFSKVISKNCSLQDLSIGFAHQKIDLSQKIKYFLKLNQAGRQELMKSKSSRQDWVEMLIGYTDDLDVLFYFLRMNPSITSGISYQPDVEITEPHGKRRKVESFLTRTMG